MVRWLLIGPAARGFKGTLGLRVPIRTTLVFFLMRPGTMWWRLLVHGMRGLLMRWRSLLVRMERAESMTIGGGIVPQRWGATGALRRWTLVLPVVMRRVSIRRRLRISRGRVTSVGGARRRGLIRVPWMCPRGLVRCARRVVGSGLSLPRPGVVLVARIAMLRVTGPVRLHVPLPMCTIIRMRWMGPPAITHRECPFPSLPITLVRFAFALHPIPIIVADRLQTRPLGIIFH